MAVIDVKTSLRLELDANEIRVVVLALREMLKKEDDVQSARDMADAIDKRRRESYQHALEVLERPAKKETKQIKEQADGSEVQRVVPAPHS